MSENEQIINVNDVGDCCSPSSSTLILTTAGPAAALSAALGAAAGGAMPAAPATNSSHERESEPSASSCLRSARLVWLACWLESGHTGGAIGRAARQC